MAGSASRERARERIMRLCEALVDARTLRLELLEELRRVVPFDAYAWLLTSVGSSPLADVPCLPELPSLIRLKYLTQVNRWTQLRSPVALLAESTKGELSRSLVWRELLHRYNIIDLPSVVFRDGYGCWCFLERWRTSTSGQFTSAEAAYLADISGPVTTALRRSQARTFRERAAPTGQAVVRSCCSCRATSTCSHRPPRPRDTCAHSCRRIRTDPPFRRALTTSPGNCSLRRPG